MRSKPPLLRGSGANLDWIRVRPSLNGGSGRILTHNNFIHIYQYIMCIHMIYLAQTSTHLNLGRPAVTPLDERLRMADHLLAFFALDGEGGLAVWLGKGHKMVQTICN